MGTPQGSDTFRSLLSPPCYPILATLGEMTLTSREFLLCLDSYLVATVVTVVTVIMIVTVVTVEQL